MKLPVIDSSGFIVSDICEFFGQSEHEDNGADTNQQAIFFGPQSNTGRNLKRLREAIPERTPR